MILRHRRAFDDYRDSHERESLDGVELIGTVFAAFCIIFILIPLVWFLGAAFTG